MVVGGGLKGIPEMVGALEDLVNTTKVNNQAIYMSTKIYTDLLPGSVAFYTNHVPLERTDVFVGSSGAI